VCGSTQGIGKACAIELASLGAEIILIARNEEKLKETIYELAVSENQKHAYIVADFSKPEELRLSLNFFLQTYENPVHILVNNTGGPPAGQITEATEEQFLNTFKAHVICNHILTTALVEKMKAANYGRIINIISTSVKTPLPNLGVSNTIRGSVASWAKTMANELGKFNITVNNVLPGATKTERLYTIFENNAAKKNIAVEDIEKVMKAEIPMQRFAEASEIASAVAFLASPAASYINGINLPVDGGRTPSL
jgi:3-oxoacyl-[acyl-carrier protein] reductase